MSCIVQNAHGINPHIADIIQIIGTLTEVDGHQQAPAPSLVLKRTMTL